MKKCLFLIVLCFFAPSVGRAELPYNARVASVPTPITEVFHQLAGTISSFYAVLFTAASDTNRPSQGTALTLTAAETVSAQPRPEEDGYILSLDGQKAHISLGKKEGVRQGLLLEIYRPKMLHDAVSGQRYPLKESLGFGLVIDVFDETSILHLSEFEVKTAVSEGKGAISDRVG